MKTILAIVGSASANSSNHQLLKHIGSLCKDWAVFDKIEDLKVYPHFDPVLSVENTPEMIKAFREKVSRADGILICTPEYVFSIPSGLKNIIEWCISTTVFAQKPLGIITASAHGAKGHEELQLIMRTVECRYNEDTLLLIHGIKGKTNKEGNITDEKTLQKLIAFSHAFGQLVRNAE